MNLGSIFVLNIKRTASFIGLAVVVIVMNNCSGASSSLGNIGYCTNSCTNSTATAPNLYISNQGFTIPKAQSFYGGCYLQCSAGSMVTVTDPSTGLTSSVPCSSNMVCSTSKFAMQPVIYRQQMQISGICSTGGAATNQISFSISNSNNTVNYPQDLYGYNYTTYATTCDSGRFSLIITPPNDGVNKAYSNQHQTTTAPFQLLVTLKTGPNLTSLTTASQIATLFYVAY